MINGFLEYTTLPWEERLGKQIRQTSGNTIENIIVSNKIIDANTLVSTLIREGQIIMVDTYITHTSGELKKVTNQYPGQPPHWTYEYEMREGELQVTRTDPERETSHYKMVVTERDSQGRVSIAEYRETVSGNVIGRIYAMRNDDGNLIQEVFEDAEEGARAVISCDRDGRWLLREHFQNGMLLMKQEYIH